VSGCGIVCFPPVEMERGIMMNSQFTDRIWDRVEPLWNNYLEHPFVRGLGEGWLEKEKFRHWLKQDDVYLIDYSRLFALGSAKAHNLGTMNEFSKLLHSRKAGVKVKVPFVFDNPFRVLFGGAVFREGVILLLPI